MTTPDTTERPQSSFDYDGRADLYPGRGQHRGKGLGYRRFDNAAQAIKYAIEEMPSAQAIGTVLEVNEQRFTMNGIVALYQHDAYPLRRGKARPAAQVSAQAGRHAA